MTDSGSGESVGPTEAVPGLLQGKKLTEALVASYRDMIPWIRFLSILGLIAGAISALFVPIAGVTLATGAQGTSITPAMLIPMAVASVFYIIAGVSLNRYGKALKSALALGSSQEMEKALDHARSFWKFAGIIGIIGAAGSVIQMIVGPSF